MRRETSETTTAIFSAITRCSVVLNVVIKEIFYTGFDNQETLLYKVNGKYGNR